MNLTLVVMGISGCGKSTYGKLLAERLDLPFVDEDDIPFSSEISGKHGTFGYLPSEDEIAERMRVLGKKLAEYADTDGVVMAASALRIQDREILGSLLEEPPLFIFLQGNIETIQQQIEQRSGHFFPTELLTREFQLLEVPEYAITVNLHPALDFSDSVEGVLLELM